MAGNDQIKNFTKQVVTFMDNPAAYRQARRNRKKEKKQRNQEQKSLVYTNRWLGLLPFAVKSSLRNRQQDH